MGLDENSTSFRGSTDFFNQQGLPLEINSSSTLGNGSVIKNDTRPYEEEKVNEFAQGIGLGKLEITGSAGGLKTHSIAPVKNPALRALALKVKNFLLNNKFGMGLAAAFKKGPTNLIKLRTLADKKASLLKAIAELQKAKSENGQTSQLKLKIERLKDEIRKDQIAIMQKNKEQAPEFMKLMTDYAKAKAELEQFKENAKNLEGIFNKADNIDNEKSEDAIGDMYTPDEEKTLKEYKSKIAKAQKLGLKIEIIDKDESKEKINLLINYLEFCINEGSGLAVSDIPLAFLKEEVPEAQKQVQFIASLYKKVVDKIQKINSEIGLINKKDLVDSELIQKLTLENVLNETYKNKLLLFITSEADKKNDGIFEEFNLILQNIQTETKQLKGALLIGKFVDGNLFSGHICTKLEDRIVVQQRQNSTVLCNISIDLNNGSDIWINFSKEDGITLEEFKRSATPEQKMAVIQNLEVLFAHPDVEKIRESIAQVKAELQSSLHNQEMPTVHASRLSVEQTPSPSKLEKEITFSEINESPSFIESDTSVNNPLILGEEAQGRVEASGPEGNAAPSIEFTTVIKEQIKRAHADLGIVYESRFRRKGHNNTPLELQERRNQLKSASINDKPELLRQCRALDRLVASPKAHLIESLAKVAQQKEETAYSEVDATTKGELEALEKEMKELLASLSSSSEQQVMNNGQMSTQVEQIHLKHLSILKEIAERNNVVAFYYTPLIEGIPADSNPTGFLGNFAPCDLNIYGRQFKCAEAAFQWKKIMEKTVTQDNDSPKLKNLRKKLIDDPRLEELVDADGRMAAAISKKIDEDYPGVFADGWLEGRRDQVMWEVVQAKFRQNPLYLEMLRATGKVPLLECKPRAGGGDKYFSDGGDGKGHNMLGMHLMAIRDAPDGDLDNAVKPDFEIAGQPEHADEINKNRTAFFNSIVKYTTNTHPTKKNEHKGFFDRFRRTPIANLEQASAVSGGESRNVMDKLGLYSPCEIRMYGKTFRCVQAAFQWRRLYNATLETQYDGPVTTKLRKELWNEIEHSPLINSTDEVEINEFVSQLEAKYTKSPIIKNSMDPEKCHTVMWELLNDRFNQNEEDLKSLKATGDKPLTFVSEQHMDDNYWYQNPNGTGHNMLGKMLTYIRDYKRKPSMYKIEPPPFEK